MDEKIDNLTLAIALLNKAKEEKKRLTEYEKEYAKAEKIDYKVKSSNGWACWKNRSDVNRKYSPLPSKAFIKDICKIVRKLLLEEY